MKHTKNEIEKPTEKKDMKIKLNKARKKEMNKKTTIPEKKLLHYCCGLSEERRRFA